MHLSKLPHDYRPPSWWITVASWLPGMVIVVDIDLVWIARIWRTSLAFPAASVLIASSVGILTLGLILDRRLGRWWARILTRIIGTLAIVFLWVITRLVGVI